MHDNFIHAIPNKKKVKLTFHSKEDNGTLIRKCAPMDYGPSRRTRDQASRYHFWDYDSDRHRHTLSLLGDQIANIEVLGETFDPAEFIRWSTKDSPWFIERNWGQYS